MSTTPNLKSKCWHLNTYIKRLLYIPEPTPPVKVRYYIDPNNSFNLVAPNTDTTSSNDSIFVFQSGKGVVNSHNLNLAQDND